MTDQPLTEGRVKTAWQFLGAVGAALALLWTLAPWQFAKAEVYGKINRLETRYLCFEKKLNAMIIHQLRGDEKSREALWLALEACGGPK